MEEVEFRISEPVSDEALNCLFANAWEAHAERSFQPVLSKSLLYVCAYKGEELVGFVNVATDGGQHAFILDTCVHDRLRKKGIGKALVREAIEAASKRGITWVHVDYEPNMTYAKETFKVSYAFDAS